MFDFSHTLATCAQLANLLFVITPKRTPQPQPVPQKLGIPNCPLVLFRVMVPLRHQPLKPQCGQSCVHNEPRSAPALAQCPQLGTLKFYGLVNHKAFSANVGRMEPVGAIFPTFPEAKRAQACAERRAFSRLNAEYSLVSQA